MRISLAIIVGFAALALAIPTVMHISQTQAGPRNLIFDVKSSTAISSDLILRDGEAQKRWFGLIWTAIRGAFTLANLKVVAKVSWGTYKLATNIYNFKKDCTGNSVVIHDCLITLSTAAVDAFTGVFLLKAIGKRGEHTVAMINHRSIPELTTVAHIPVINGSLIRASIKSHNNGTWVHHATTYDKDGSEVYHLLYRRAHPDDLGFANNGSYHHYRLQSAPNPSTNTTKRTDMQRNDGMVFDYSWQDE